MNRRRHASLTTLIILATAIAAACSSRSSEAPDRVADPATKPATPAGSEGRVLAIVGATVIPGDGSAALANRTVLVEGDRITAVGPAGSVAVPAGAEVVAATGRFVVPGLIDMGVYGLTEDDGELYVAHGITTIRHLRGSTLHLSWRERAASKKTLGPWIHTSRTAVDGPKNAWQGPTSPVTGAGDAGPVVEHHARFGYDHVRIGDTLTLEAYNAVVDAAAARGIPVIGDVPAEVGVEGLRQRSMLWLHAVARELVAPQLQASGRAMWGTGARARYLTMYAAVDSARAGGVAQAVRARGTAVAPGLLAFDRAVSTRAELTAALADPALQVVAPEWHRFQRIDSLAALEPDVAATRERARTHYRALFRALVDAGVRVVPASIAGRFVPPGASLHDELTLWAEAGVSPPHILRAATHDAAAVLGLADEIGSVAVGKRADLVIVDADPRADIGHLRRIHGVVLRGAWHDRAGIATRLAARPPRYERETAFMKTLAEGGVDAARAALREARATDPKAQLFREETLLFWAYSRMKPATVDVAIDALELVREARPDSFNAYDSLGMAHATKGDRARAVELYRRSLELFPGNDSAVTELEKLDSLGADYAVAEPSCPVSRLVADTGSPSRAREKAP